MVSHENISGHYEKLTSGHENISGDCKNILGDYEYITGDCENMFELFKFNIFKLMVPQNEN